MTVMIRLHLNNHGERQTTQHFMHNMCFSLQALQSVWTNEKPQWSPCSMKTGIKKVGHAVD